MKKAVFAMALALTGLIGGAIVPTGVAMAAVTCPEGSLRGPGATADSIAQCNIEETNDSESLLSRVKVIINVVLGLIGVVAVVMIIIGGIGFTTSQGDAAKVTKAKNTVLYGVIGLVVALLAYAIVNFVLTGVFGS